MLIQCPSCDTQAQIPDSKEGAKVRCASCGKIYVARDRSGRGRGPKKEDPTKYFLIGGVVLAAIAIAVMSSSGEETDYSEKTAEVEEPKKDTTPYVDPMGWDGPTVSLARSMHKAAYTGDESRLKSKLDPASAYEFAGHPDATAEDEPAAASENETPEGEAVAEAPAQLWADVGEVERVQWTSAYMDEVLTAGVDGVVTAWKPFDGKVVSLEGGIAIVHVRVAARDASLGVDDRWTRWTFKNLDGEGGTDDRWRWIAVDRYISPEEAAKGRRKGKVRAEKKTLTDGSVVYESKIRAIPFPADMDGAEQTRLTELVASLVEDIDARPSVRSKFSAQLTEAGKPAIPALLTKMAELSETLTTDSRANEDSMVRINWINNVLRDITGNETTFVVDVSMGGTKERIDSGLKQWYGWYDRKFKRFDGLEVSGDPLMDDPNFVPRTPEERRKYQKNLEEQLRLEREKNRK